jgi:hypothetical protein
MVQYIPVPVFYVGKFLRSGPEADSFEKLGPEPQKIDMPSNTGLHFVTQLLI